MSQPMLEGEYVGIGQPTSRERELSQENYQLHETLARLRAQLKPLYTALQGIFNDLPDGAAANPDVPARVSEVWQDWKTRVPQPSARIIDALLLHGALNTQQLAVAAKMHRNNVPKYIWHLNKANLIDKNGGRYSLKQL